MNPKGLGEERIGYAVMRNMNVSMSETINYLCRYMRLEM